MEYNNFMIRIAANKHVWRDGIDLYIWKRINNKSQYFNGKEWVDHKEGEIIDPSSSLEIKDAQYLMDSLWDCGIRPTEGNGSAGAIRATENHLKDMRRLVFGNYEKLNETI